MNIIQIQRKSKSVSIFDFADICGLDLDCRQRDDGVILAVFSRAEVKDGACLSSSYGRSDAWGQNPGLSRLNRALRDYARRIQGRRLVLNAFGINRREINVPNRLHVPVVKQR